MKFFMIFVFCFFGFWFLVVSVLEREIYKETVHRFIQKGRKGRKEGRKKRERKGRKEEKKGKKGRKEGRKGEEEER